MMATTVYPNEALLAVDARLQALLSYYVRAGRCPRCLLAFVGEDQLALRPQFKTDPDWKILHVGISEGLMGHALRVSGVHIWRRGFDGSLPFIEGDPRTIYEVATCIYFREQPTAVLLVDYFEGDGFREPSVWDVESWSKEIGDILRAFEAEYADIQARILRAAELCVEQTGSLRGYVAIKRWDGRFRYFVAGVNTQHFRYYSQLEGICGDVIRKGVFQNVSYVWDHVHYRSSDDYIQSEAVAPIVVNDDVVGVVNLESAKRAHFTDEHELVIKQVAADLSSLADRFRKPVGGGISAHSRMLSDLVEQLSAPNDIFSDDADDQAIWRWATELCRLKISRLEDVKSVSFGDILKHSAFKGKKDSAVRRAEDGSEGFKIVQEGNGRFFCDFDVILESITTSHVRVWFDYHPNLATLEIIDQFCRLASNEVRRRNKELRGKVFENFVERIRNISAHGIRGEMEVVFGELPGLVRRLILCDHVTYFRVVGGISNNVKILTVWQSTADTLVYNSDEQYYRVAEDDGFTGFAATQREILMIKNVQNLGELGDRWRSLKWKGKIAEEERMKFRSFFAVPIYFGGEVIGLLRGHRTMRYNSMSFSESDRRMLESIRYLLEGMLDRVGIVI